MSDKELNAAEKALVEHVRQGKWLDPAADDKVIDEESMRSWGNARTCDASVIRDILQRRRVTDPDLHGIRIRGIRIAGPLDLENLDTNIRLELSDCLIEEGIFAADAHLAYLGLTGCLIERSGRSALQGPPASTDRLADAGAVDLTSAHIDGQLNLSRTRLRNDFGPALSADGIHVSQDMSLTDGFTAVGSGTKGAICLLGAQISGQLNFSKAQLHNGSGPALIADRLQVGQDMFFTAGSTATGSGKNGTIRMVGAHIAAGLDLSGSYLRNTSGPALAADRLQVGESMFLNDGFTAVGSGSDGAVRLLGAQIFGTLNSRNAHLRNDSGPAISADRLQVGQSVSFTENFIATGKGELGAVRLFGAHIAGRLKISEVYLGNDSGPAFLADGLQVGQSMSLAGSFIAAGDTAVIDLQVAQIHGMLAFAPSCLVHETDARRRLIADGLTYSGVPQRIRGQVWLELLRNGTPGYAAQPYQQLAAGYKALGDDRQAREILIAQRDDQLTRADTSKPERLWGRFTKVTLNYGYQPWRALLFLLGVLAISCLLAVELGSHGALTQLAGAAATNRPCTTIQKVSVGLDLNLPVGTTLARANCGLAKDSASAAADWLAMTSWLLRLLAWAFAALFIAGFTSAVRKT